MATPSENVFAPPKSTVLDVDSAEAVKASRGIRLLAKIIDGLLLTVGFIPAYIAIISQYVHGGTRGPVSAVQVWAALAQTGGRFYLGIAVVLIVVVLDALWVAGNGQTVGKRICGIKIVRSDGSPATFWRVFLRRYLISALLPLVPVIGGLYALVDICFIFSSTRRCVHDHIADTIVIRA